MDGSTSPASAEEAQVNAADGASLSTSAALRAVSALHHSRFSNADRLQIQCDECRRRRVRCDRKRPCSHCRTATLVSDKTSEYKIDRISDRLASIEQLLRTGTVSSRHSPASDTAISVQNVTSQPTQDDSPSVVPSIGYTGPNAETLAAKDVLEQTMESDPVIQQDQKLGTALASLHNIVGRLDVDTEASVDYYNPSELLQVTLPSWAQVEKILDDAESRMILSSFPVIDY
nr:hypothetical protein CFP56_28849 [Quercus suber]